MKNSTILLMFAALLIAWYGQANYSERIYLSHIESQRHLFREHCRMDSLEVVLINKKLQNAGLYHQGITLKHSQLNNF